MVTVVDDAVWMQVQMLPATALAVDSSELTAQDLTLPVHEVADVVVVVTFVLPDVDVAAVVVLVVPGDVMAVVVGLVVPEVDGAVVVLAEPDVDAVVVIVLAMLGNDDVVVSGTDVCNGDETVLDEDFVDVPRLDVVLDEDSARLILLTPLTVTSVVVVPPSSVSVVRTVIVDVAADLENQMSASDPNPYTNVVEEEPTLSLSLRQW